MVKGVVSIEGMSCRSCKRKIEDAVMEIQGVESAEVNLQEKLLYIEFDDQSVSFDKVKLVVEGHKYLVNGCRTIKHFD